MSCWQPLSQQLSLVYSSLGEGVPLSALLCFAVHSVLLMRCCAVQVVYGLILGLIGCFICSLTRIWNNGFKRTTAVLFSGLAIMWLGLKLNYLGASSVGCLSLTVLVSLAWERGFPPRLCKGELTAASAHLFCDDMTPDVCC